MENKKTIALITKLNRDTKEGKLNWQISRVQPVLSIPEVVLDNIYYTKVEQKLLRLYKYSTKYYFDEDSFEWTTGFRLEFVDNYWKSEWAFPEIAMLADLYETVRYKTSGIEDFLDKYLEGEEEQNQGDELPF